MEQHSLFDNEASQPLAARLRPRSLDEFFGQEHLLSKGKVLRRLIESDQISFDKISDSIVTDRLRKTNIDEMTDSELRDFVKDLLRYV